MQELAAPVTEVACALRSDHGKPGHLLRKAGDLHDVWQQVRTAALHACMLCSAILQRPANCRLMPDGLGCNGCSAMLAETVHSVVDTFNQVQLHGPCARMHALLGMRTLLHLAGAWQAEPWR